MRSLWHGNTFHITGPLCGESPGTSPHKGPITEDILGFLDSLYVNKLLNEQSACRWFETPWRSYDVTVWKGAVWRPSSTLSWPPTSTAFGTRRVNTLRARQDGRHFPDDIFKCIFLNENVKISIKISMKFVSKGPINNIPALLQIMAWRRPGDKPLSEPMMVCLPTHICVTRPQWVKWGVMSSCNRSGVGHLASYLTINISIISTSIH